MKKLIEKVQKGNVEAFKKLYNLKKDYGFQLCYALCQNHDDATEACQQGFIKIFRSIKNLREVKYFDSWFYRIMMNCAYDVIKVRKFENMDKPIADNDDSENNFSHTQLILSALKDLADGYRTVFILHFFQELKHADIGKILNCSPETSRSQYARSKEKIREVLKNKMELNIEEI
jgi:RNA polymerase sigma-70 factor (ECF subfamily)